MDDQLQILQKIQKVPAPPFLLTRIQAGLQQAARAGAPLKWAFAAAAVLLLACNLATLLHHRHHSAPQTEAQSLANSLHLSPSNDLYHE